MERAQFTFYRSFWEAIKELPVKARSEIVCAICAYALDGEAPKLSGTSKAIFALIKPTLDASAKKAEIGKLGGSKEKAKGKQDESKTEAEPKQTAREKEKENEKENEIESEGEYECTPPPKGSPPLPEKENSKAKAKPSKRKYGAYGWVRLTQEEFDRLLAELGQEELDRCITYVDESAQKSGNKNRWKDWNLVIRNCHREGWGLRSYGARNAPPAGNWPTVPEAGETARMAALLDRMDRRETDG